jgi:hypothetical protein
MNSTELSEVSVWDIMQIVVQSYSIWVVLSLLLILVEWSLHNYIAVIALCFYILGEIFYLYADSTFVERGLKISMSPPLRLYC